VDAPESRKQAQHPLAGLIWFKNHSIRFTGVKKHVMISISFSSSTQQTLLGKIKGRAKLNLLHTLRFQQVLSSWIAGIGSRALAWRLEVIGSTVL